MAATSQTTEQEVMQAFKAWGDAWNRGDMNGYMAGYHKDVRTVYNMHIMNGWQAINDMNHARFDTAEKMGKISTENLEVTPIGDTDAIIFGIMKRDHGDFVLEATFTAHLRKIDGDWFIMSEHGATE